MLTLPLLVQFRPDRLKLPPLCNWPLLTRLPLALMLRLRPACSCKPPLLMKSPCRPRFRSWPASKVPTLPSAAVLTPRLRWLYTLPLLSKRCALSCRLPLPAIVPPLVSWPCTVNRLSPSPSASTRPPPLLRLAASTCKARPACTRPPSLSSWPVVTVSAAWLPSVPWRLIRLPPCKTRSPWLLSTPWLLLISPLLRVSWPLEVILPCALLSNWPRRVNKVCPVPAWPNLPP
ncbi:hypothetical protein A203_21635 [Chromobacterium violaceum]